MEPENEYMGANDPYRGMSKSDIAPELGAAKDLREAEKKAADKAGLGVGGDAKSREENPQDSNFLSMVRGRAAGGEQSFGARVKQVFLKGGRKKGLIAFVSTLLIGAGGGILAVQSTTPFALANRVIDEYNTAYISGHWRLPYAARVMLVKGKCSDDVKEAMARHGIEISEDGKRFMVRDSDGRTVKMTAEEAFKNKDVRGRLNVAFKESTGQYMTTFGVLSSRVKTRLKISFNKFANHSEKEQAKSETKKETIKETLKNSMGDVQGGVTSAVPKEGENPPDVEDKQESISSKDSKSTIKYKLANITLSGVSGGLCAKATISTAIALQTMGVSLSNMLNVASLGLEAVQKAQAGYGEGSPLHEFMISLFDRDENGQSAMDAPSIQRLFGSRSTESGINFEGVLSTAKGLSRDWAVCYGGQVATSVISIAVSIIPMAKVAKVFQVAGKMSTKIGKALPMTFSVGDLVGIGLSQATAIAINEYLETAAENIQKEFAAMQTTKGFTYGEQFGNGSNALLTAFSKVTGTSAASESTLRQYQNAKTAALAEDAEHERSTRSPLDASSPHTFLGSFVQSLAPLATTNSTNLLTGVSSVLGSSLAGLVPNSQAIGQTSVVTQTGNCPLLESVDAVGDPNCMYYNITDASTLGSAGSYNSKAATVGSDCDMACVIDKIFAIDEQFNEEKKDYDTESFAPTIKAGSDLARYALYCGERDSQLGLVDGSILEKLHNESPSAKVLTWFQESAISQLVGTDAVAELIQTYEDTTDDNRDGWVKGFRCVATSDKKDKNYDWWQREGKWYQRFLEDQTLLANMGVIEQSAASALLAQHPVDNSEEAVLARVSGMPKAVVSLLNKLEEQQSQLVSYDPAGLQPVAQEEPVQQVRLEVVTPLTGRLAEAVNLVALRPEKVFYSRMNHNITA